LLLAMVGAQLNINNDKSSIALLIYLGIAMG